jgi:ribosomal protein L40E
MTHKLRCPNGHKLRFAAKDSGKKAICPTCQASFLLPRVETHVSDTSILSVLGAVPSDRSVIALPSTVVPTAASTKMCPKCKARIGSRYQICPHCRTYLPLSRH